MSYPDPILIKTITFVCDSCRRTVRVPAWQGEDGLGECEHCGCTSSTMHDGRPFGPRSQAWEYLIEEWRWFSPPSC